MSDKIYAYHVSWRGEREGHWHEGFGHFESSVIIAPLQSYLHFVSRVRADIAQQVNDSDRLPIRLFADNIKLTSINYLGEYEGDMEEKS